MKIVHVLPALIKGGGERVVADLSNYAAAQGHSVTVVSALRVPANLLEDRLRPEVEVRFIRPNDRRLKGAYLVLVPWILRNREWLLSQDVVHCHLSYGSAFGAALQWVRGSRKKPAIVETYHAVGVEIPERQRLAHELLLSGRDAVAFVAEDPKWTRYTAARPRGLFRLIPNGVAPPPVDEATADRFRTERTAIPAQPDAVIGTVGRLAPERRPDLLLETFARVAATVGDGVHLLLGGEGPVKAKLESDARRHGLENRVHLPGLILDPAEPFALMDLYLTINVGPITGIAALEAALSGLPVVAVQLQEGYKAEQSDWIWSSTDLDEVAARIAELIADRSQLRALARRQQAHARAHHTIEAMAEAYRRLYDDALAARGGPPRD